MSLQQGEECDPLIPFIKGSSFARGCFGCSFRGKATSAGESVPLPTAACSLLQQSSPSLICEKLARNTACSSHFNFAKLQQVTPISHSASPTASLLGEGHSQLRSHRTEFSDLTISSRRKVERVVSVKSLSCAHVCDCGLPDVPELA